MVKISCPFCTKQGISMVIIGLALVMISVVIATPWLAVIGLIFLLAAYIVPNLRSGEGCHTSGCTNPAHNHGEEESQ
ncbi:MAG: hypothetical protein ACFE8O_06135 [Candidatus Hermodarchaeota archaeon]